MVKRIADIMVDGLLADGIDTLFGIPGAQTYPIFDACHNTAGKINVIAPRHEQGAAYMAMGYARSTGRASACSVVPGPGLLNASAGLVTAAGVNAPVICLTGEVPAEFVGSGRGHLHELKDQLSTLRSVVKWAGHIAEPDQAPALVAEAFTHMHSGRKGPVTIQASWDVLPQTTEKTYVKPDIPSVEVDHDAVDRAVAILAESKNPMIMVGGGALDASAEVTRLAEYLEAPVTAFRSGKGVVSDESDFSVCAPAGYALWQDTDVLIVIGSRAELQLMRWGDMMTRITSIESKKIIRIDIDPTEFGRIRADVNVLGDAASATTALLNKLAAANVSSSGNHERIKEVQAKLLADIQEVQPQMDYLNLIRDVLPRDGFFVEELCQMGFTSNFGFPVYEPRTYVTPGYQGTLGFGFNTALGVKVANPDKAVLSVTGDGGFMFGMQELATAAQHNIGVVTLVFNNGVYGNVLRDQQTRFDGHVIGADMAAGNPDYVRLAESFGVAGYRVTSPAELKPVLERAISDNKPALIDVVVPTGSETSPWKFIHPQMA
ncbi:thiamine pyrophosphate-dependent enzyme [Porticoccus sp. GXU_MW_L64]